MNPKLWPNVLSVTRIALMPALLMTAMMGSRQWFVVVLVVSLVTDALDGYLARKLNAFSEFGRTLDSFADYVVLITGIAGIALLWPDLMRGELVWVVVGLAAFFTVLAYGYARFGRPLRYHTWASKVLSPALALSMVPLLGEITPVPFHIVIVLQVAAALEQLCIALLVPSHKGEIASVWHAMAARRESMALLTPRRTRIGKRR
jgi:phosphatidylglycerophosphate synthase